jgi:hypothetical protein
MEYYSNIGFGKWDKSNQNHQWNWWYEEGP